MRKSDWPKTSPGAMLDKGIAIAPFLIVASPLVVRLLDTIETWFGDAVQGATQTSLSIT